MPTQKAEYLQSYIPQQNEKNERYNRRDKIVDQSPQTPQHPEERCDNWEFQDIAAAGSKDVVSPVSLDVEGDWNHQHPNGEKKDECHSAQPFATRRSM